MGENKITRDVYKHYANRIVDVLKDEGFYQQFKKRVDKGSASFKLAKKRLIQDISIDWIDTIESILPNLDTIVRNPRKFIVQEEDIVDVSLARSISTESVKFLAQHTNMISKVDKKTGDVTPSKILNITKEESFEIYENRFIYTLLLKLKDFVTMRYDKIKKASATQDVLELDVESRFNLPSKKITYRTEYFAQLSFDEVMRLDPDTLTKIERVAKIDRIITDFLSSSFAKSMRHSAPVRPPIMRTNVILKEPNFKKALTLWQFVETYQATGGFSTSDEVEDLPLEDDAAVKLREMVTLNTMLFESMYDQYESDLDMEDKQFADVLRIGQMEFEKDKIDRDEYSQKLDDQKQNEDEQDNVEEVKPKEDDDAETEIKPESSEAPPDEQEPNAEKQGTHEVEKPVEIETEVVVERPVEVERLKEMPPKADQEEVDLEPDAEKFDQHLFEVRKIYKRPDDDKIKQEEIIKVKDAIDRCLTSYRRIKQEELDDRERQARIRRRKEDIQKRAEAFKKQRIDLENSGDSVDGVVYFGIDPFSYQKAKIAEAKRSEEEKRRQDAIKIDKNEHLELDDTSTDEINKSIEEMEKDRARRQKLDETIDKSLEEAERAPEQPTVESEQKQESKPRKKGKIRLASDQSVDPWAMPTAKKNINLTPVDENKVQVGDIHLKDGESITPWGDNANLGNLEPKTPSKPRKKKVEPQDNSQEQSQSGQEGNQSGESGEVNQEPKARASRDKGAISATTLNQKYSTPSGKQRHFDAVDFNKVAVGGIHFSDGTSIDDPYGGAFGFTANKAETGREVNLEAELIEEEPKVQRKPRKPRAKNLPRIDDVTIEEEKTDNSISLDVEEAHTSQVLNEVVDTQDINVQKEERSTDNSIQEDVKEVKRPRKPRQKKDNELSPTTLNQKYSKPSGKQRQFDVVDVNKVGVGGIHFSDGTSIDDPFGGTFSVTSNRAEDDE